MILMMNEKKIEKDRSYSDPFSRRMYMSVQIYNKYKNKLDSHAAFFARIGRFN